MDRVNPNPLFFLEIFPQPDILYGPLTKTK